MDWSPWRIWFNPRCAFEEMAEYAQAEADLSAKLTEAVRQLDEQRRKEENLNVQNVELRRRLAAAENKLNEVQTNYESIRNELDNALINLNEHKSINEKMKEYEREKGQMEKMKHNYEKRIVELEARLADARLRLSEKEDNELIEPFDMTTGLQLRKPVSESEEKPRTTSGNRRGSFLSRETKNPQQANNNRANRDEDDWLLELPDF